MPETKPQQQQAISQPIASVSPSAQHGRGVSVISKALKITGQLESTEDIQIEGEVDGDVRGVTVKVGANAKIKGTVFGEEVEVSGTVDGKIEAKKVVLMGTAHMSGDVVHQDIQIASGAFIDGHLKPEYGKTASKVVRAAE
jgi:cytoskeletal protein CcmA (bactofilin family)